MTSESLPKMRQLRLDELCWLHDAQVPSITFDSTGEHSLRLLIKVNFEAGSPNWDGKQILVVALDLHCLAMRTHPVVGIETINSFDSHDSDAFRQERAMGTSRLVEYAIAFHSGAELRFMCRQLLVAVTE